MATIQSQLRLNDGMSTVLRQVTSALDTCLASYEQLQATSQKAVDIGGITSARVGLSEANAVIDDMTAGLRRVENQQNSVNRTVRAGTSVFDGMLGKIAQMALTYASMQSVQSLIGLSDNITSTQARLSFIVDDGGSVESLEADIFASATRARAAYLDTAGAIASMSANAGNAFSGNSEVIAFMEQINKQFVIGGATAQGQSAAMLQLTQAMAAGALRGEELNSILENAPSIERAIESYMGIAEGSIKQYAQEGAVTAEVIKNAIFSVADETNARFEEMPLTWAQVWTDMGNTAILTLQPLLSYLNNLANDTRVQGAVNGLMGALNALVVVAVPTIDLLVNSATWIAENWELLAPIMLGLAAAWAGYTIQVNAANIASAAHAVQSGIITVGKVAATAATWLFTGATLAQFSAQWGLNAALYACPLVWIILIIVAVIGAIYLVVAAVNKFAGTSVSATGIIFGVFNTLWAHIFNSVVVPWWNQFAALSNFIGNLFNNPVAAIQVLFFDMAQTVIGYILNLARAIEGLINKIPGVQVNITAGLDGFYKQLESASQKVKDESGWVEYVGTLDFMDYGQAWNTGYAEGQRVESNIGDMFNTSSITGAANPASSLLSGIDGNITDIASNTGSVASSVKKSSEDMSVLRDTAEREAVNHFTTAEIKVDMTGMTNRIDSSMDIDGVISHFTEGVREALITSAEGVHK